MGQVRESPALESKKAWSPEGEGSGEEVWSHQAEGQVKDVSVEGALVGSTHGDDPRRSVPGKDHFAG